MLNPFSKNLRSIVPYQGFVLTDFNNDLFVKIICLSHKIRNLTRKNLVIARMKIASPFKCNSVLRKTEEILKEESTKRIEIIWNKPDVKDKTREVTVDGVPAFRQNISDSSGCFLSPFASLSI